jgi:hypothetical protein
MLLSRIVATLGILVLATGAVPSEARSQGGVCANPTFRIPQNSPFPLPPPRPGVKIDLMTALNAGTYIARPDPGADCGCDLAVALATNGDGTEGFVALMRGNENGSFTLNPGGLLEVEGAPALLASGRFRQDVKFDGVVAVTSRPGENGSVQVFVPDAAGKYSRPQTGAGPLATGPDPVAVTTGDFNGDGRLDAAVANMGNSSVTILLGTGAGTFAPDVVTVSNLGGIPESITAGKFSGSSVADDIAISLVENVGGPGRVGIVIVKGSTTGSFGPPSPIIPVGQLNSGKSWIATANLSGPTEGNAGRRFRDLAIAFMDRTPTGDAIGRIKVLLGRNDGSFVPAQTHDTGALPRSIKVADIDEDGVVDLIVSTYGDLSSQGDGTVRLFQGRAAPAPDAGFNANSNWFDIPADTGIRPRNLVAGRFGRNSPGVPPAPMGIAAINAPSIDSVSVFLGNGQGAFVQASQVTSQLGSDDRLFVPGDFHSTDGNDSLLDLAFVTRVSDRNVLAVLESNGVGGFEKTFGPRLALAGNTPVLMAGGPFAPSGPLGIAIVNEADALGGQPLLKVFFGEGNGGFKPGSELVLSGAGRPRAIATGHFRGPEMPLDIAIAGDTTPAGSSVASGMVTVLFNDGSGRFTVGKSNALDFAPGSMVASNHLTQMGKSDLLIRKANTNEFLFLVNIDNGDFRPAGTFGGAGNVDALLVGDVAGSTRPDGLDDVLTYDGNMTLRIFVNNGLESFVPRTVARPSHPSFQGAQLPYVLADFGDGKLVLAAPVVRDATMGLVLLEGNGQGGFSVASGEVPLRPFDAEWRNTSSKTEFSIPPLPQLFDSVDVSVVQGLAATFRSSLHGNGKPDLGFVLTATERSLAADICAADPQPLPPPIPGKPATPDHEVCNEVQLSTFECQEILQPVPCFGTLCEIVPGTPATPPIPFTAFCRTAQSLGPVLTVYGNTCSD